MDKPATVIVHPHNHLSWMDIIRFHFHRHDGRQRSLGGCSRPSSLYSDILVRCQSSFSSRQLFGKGRQQKVQAARATASLKQEDTFIPIKVHKPQSPLPIEQKTTSSVESNDNQRDDKKRIRKTNKKKTTDGPPENGKGGLTTHSGKITRKAPGEE